MQPRKWPLVLLISVAGCLAVTFVCVCAVEVLLLMQPLPASPQPLTPTATFTLVPTASPTAKPSKTPVPTPTSTSTLEAIDLPACLLQLTDILDKAENSTYLEGQQFSKRYELVIYSVDGDKISDPSREKIPSDLESYQADTATQQSIWNYVIAVIPSGQRTKISNFLLYSDGLGGTWGGVKPSSDNPHNWVFMLDMLDMVPLPNRSTTVVHELGHLLTLDDTQVTIDFQVLNNPFDQKLFDKEAAACSTYFTHEGCSHPDSYINLFFQKFWPDIFEEWKGISAELDPDILDKNIVEFYWKYRLQFVTTYAAFSPSEDIAESWKYFVFKPQPEGSTIADQKVQFFYDYPELVALRTVLIEGLCRNMDQP